MFWNKKKRVVHYARVTGVKKFQPGTVEFLLELKDMQEFISIRDKVLRDYASGGPIQIRSDAYRDQAMWKADGFISIKVEHVEGYSYG